MLKSTSMYVVVDGICRLLLIINDAGRQFYKESTTITLDEKRSSEAAISGWLERLVVPVNLPKNTGARAQCTGA
jgi:hypothetical protein